MPARDASTKLRLAEYGQEDFLTMHNFGQQALSAVGSGRLMAYLYNEQDETFSRDRVISITHKYVLCAHCMLVTHCALLGLHCTDLIKSSSTSWIDALGYACKLHHRLYRTGEHELPLLT